MPARFLSDAQREQLSGFPAEFDAEGLDRFFTLSGADLVEVGCRHADGRRLGWALQLCGLRVLGFCPDDVTTAPAGAVRFVAWPASSVATSRGGRVRPASPAPQRPREPGEDVRGLPVDHRRRFGRGP